MKIAVFVDGCFWHGHDCRNTTPSDNKEYWDRKHQRLNTMRDWFKQESISIHPCAAFFHLAEQANLYIPTFKEDMKNLMRMEKEYWIRVAHLDSELKGTNDNACFWGEIWKNVFLAKCYEACYEKEDIFIEKK